MRNAYELSPIAGALKQNHTTKEVNQNENENTQCKVAWPKRTIVSDLC